MAAEGGGPPPPVRAVGRRLFAAPYEFDFFQAVRVLERIFPKRRAVGRRAAPGDEVIRFRAHQPIAFPPSVITELLAPDAAMPLRLLTETYLGLTEPSGARPHPYPHRTP